MEDRNRAIRDLADALARLSRADRTGDQQSVRININPAGPVKGEDAELYHSIDVTPKAAQALADAIDSMNAYLASEQPDRLGGVGDWSAEGTDSRYPFLTAAVEDFFAAEVDFQAVFDDVLDHPQVDRDIVLRAMDDVLGDIPAPTPFADEDDV